MRGLSFLIFVFITVFCWGLYGPILHLGQEAMADEAGNLARLKPLMAVGFAYFMIAVLYPVAILFTKGESGHWSLGGFIWSFAAGAIGAIGALGIILAFNLGGRPIFVMPLVFGCAPVVNTFATMFFSRTIKEASVIFYIGIAVVAIGAAGVMVFNPSNKQTSGDESGQATEQIAGEGSSQTADGEGNAATSQNDDSEGEKNRGIVRKAGDWVLMLVAICITALCWGGYGPVLHKGQQKMGDSRLRPFLCVGLAYFVIAVLVPIPFLSTDAGKITFMGSTWSLLAGIAGAFGALGIIYAFNFGGRPIYVMPMVFGGAPVVNTLSSTIAKGLWGEIGLPFQLSLALVILGAVTVLITAPRSDEKTAEKPTKATKPAKPDKKSHASPGTAREANPSPNTTDVSKSANPTSETDSDTANESEQSQKDANTENN